MVRILQWDFTLERLPVLYKGHCYSAKVHAMSFSLRFRKITSSLVAMGLMLTVVGCGPEASTPAPTTIAPVGTATPPAGKPGPAKPKEQTSSSTTDDEKKGDEVPEPAAKSDG